MDNKIKRQKKRYQNKTQHKTIKKGNHYEIKALI